MTGTRRIGAALSRQRYQATPIVTDQPSTTTWWHWLLAAAVAIGASALPT